MPTGNRAAVVSIATAFIAAAGMFPIVFGIAN
jgi:hypothetical protein